jgi:hypothetical protein
VLFLDLDGFKDVNDATATGGDAGLRAVADRLTAAVRPATRWPASAATSSSSWSRAATPAGMSALVARLPEAVQEPLLVRGTPSTWG